MKKSLKILVIFLFALISIFTIYKTFDNKKPTIVSIGDSLSLGKTPFSSYGKNYNYYFKRSFDGYYNDSISYDDLTYEELYRKIYYDEKVYDKGKYVNIKNVISKSDILIINANTSTSFKKCNKGERIFTEYLDSTFERITKIVDIIQIFSLPRIVVLTPYCYSYNTNINNHIEKYYIYKDVRFINLYSKLHLKSYYIPNKNNPYPSLEGHNLIYNELLKESKIN